MGKPKRWTVILYRSVALLESKGMDRRKDNRIMTVLPSATAGTWVSIVIKKPSLRMVMHPSVFKMDELNMIQIWRVVASWFLIHLLRLSQLHIQLSHLPMSDAITKWPKSSGHFEGGNLSTKLPFFLRLNLPVKLTWPARPWKWMAGSNEISFFFGVSADFQGRFWFVSGVVYPPVNQYGNWKSTFFQ